MSTLSQIREIEQAIQDAEQLYNVLRVFPRDITIGEFEDTIKETLPQGGHLRGEGIQQAYSINKPSSNRWRRPSRTSRSIILEAILT